MTTYINCPACNTPITVETNALLQGTQFKCNKCQSVISMAKESVPTATKAMEAFHHIKSKAK